MRAFLSQDDVQYASYARDSDSYSYLETSDEELFTMVKAQYFKETSRVRRFLALRGIKKISYVKFVHAPREPDIHKYDDWPLQKHSPPWIYKGCPAKKKHIPLVGHTYLLHLWQNPSHSDAETYRSQRAQSLSFKLPKLLHGLKELRGLPSASKPNDRDHIKPRQDVELASVQGYIPTLNQASITECTR